MQVKTSHFNKAVKLDYPQFNFNSLYYFYRYLTGYEPLQVALS